MTTRARDRVGQFRSVLRQQSSIGPGRGVTRFARLVRSGAGLATRMVAAGRQSEETALSDRDVRNLEALVQRLGELKGLPMKFGQIVSYLEISMPEEARGLLGLLQTQSPAMGFDEVTRVVTEDLGKRAPRLLEGLEREPASTASIGQVHRGRLPDGMLVAVKVRHPDIEDAIVSDFRVASVGTSLAGLMVPGMGETAHEFVDEMKARFLEECDYTLERERQQLFAKLYAGHPVIVVPPVHAEWSGRRVLTSCWITGRDFETFCAEATQQQRNRAGAALFDFYMGTLYRDGVFHADPHPGNYQFLDDGRVVVFDYGCVRVFDALAVRAFVALADAVRDDDRRRTEKALRALGAEPPKRDASYAHLRGLLRSFFAPMLKPGTHRIDGRIVLDMRQTARDKMAIARIRLPGKFMFLFRIRFGLYAVLSRLGAECDWAALEQGFADQVAPATRGASSR